MLKQRCADSPAGTQLVKAAFPPKHHPCSSSNYDKQSIPLVCRPIWLHPANRTSCAGSMAVQVGGSSRLSQQRDEAEDPPCFPLSCKGPGGRLTGRPASTPGDQSAARVRGHRQICCQVRVKENTGQKCDDLVIIICI